MLKGCRTWIVHSSSTRICISMIVQDRVEGMIMIGMVLVKKDMLRYVRDLRAVSRIGRCLSDHHVILCEVRLVDAWIKRGNVVNLAMMISEKLKEHP